MPHSANYDNISKTSNWKAYTPVGTKYTVSAAKVKMSIHFQTPAPSLHNFKRTGKPLIKNCC